MARTGSEKPLFPTDRAFVVQFRGGGSSTEGGRVEHIKSGRSVRFADAQSLLAFIEETLAGRVQSNKRQEDES